MTSRVWLIALGLLALGHRGWAQVGLPESNPPPRRLQYQPQEPYRAPVPDRPEPAEPSTPDPVEVPPIKTPPGRPAAPHRNIERAPRLPQTVWAVGQYFGQIRQTKRAIWCLRGIYATEQEAKKNCTGKAWFIGPVVLGAPPMEGPGWDGCYYPNGTPEGGGTLTQR